MLSYGFQDLIVFVLVSLSVLYWMFRIRKSLFSKKDTACNSCGCAPSPTKKAFEPKK